MAEVVQLHIEDTLPELEQMERVGLFRKEEIKRIIRRRKAFEYKLQRKRKSKEDYLAYIQYEIGLLSLIKKRREKIGYKFKKKKIDHSIASRINRLFKAVIYKFQDDPKLWLSHIEFCKKMGWKHTISGMFLRMLQVHNKTPEFWVTASKWEMEECNFVTARSLLQRALRFHPQSQLLWQECYRMELAYVEHIRKRRQVLGISDKEQEFDVSEAVLNGQIAMTVFEKAVEAINDIHFAITFLPICTEFDFTAKHHVQIINYLKNTFTDKEETWDVLARETFFGKDKIVQDGVSKGLKKKDIIRSLEKKAMSLYEEAVNKIATEKMWGLYIQFLLDTLSQCTSEKRTRKVMSKVLNVMERASALECLSMNYALEWLKLLHSCQDLSKSKEVALGIARKWLTKVEPWMMVLTLHIINYENEQVINNLFQEALSNLPKKQSLPVWQLYIEWASAIDPSHLESLLKNCVMNELEIGHKFKELYLEVTALKKGIKSARKLYQKLLKMKPLTPSFFDKMIAIENAEVEPSIKRIRRCYTDALLEFGKDNVDLWIKQIEFEIHNRGSPHIIGHVYWQALANLHAEKSDDFIHRFTLLQTGYGNNFEAPTS